MVKVYITGSCRKRILIRDLMNKIEMMGHTIVVDWTKRQPNGDAREYAIGDTKGLKECDCLIYCLDETKSRGKYFELGYATAIGKPIALYILPDSGRLRLDYIMDEESVFVKAKLYHILHSMNELKSWLSTESSNKRVK